MADPAASAVNSGEEATNASATGMPLDSAAQFRTLSQRLDALTGQIATLQKPPTIRVMDVVQFIALVVAFLVAIFTAWGFKDRIDDLVKAQIGSETRLAAQITAGEARTGGRIDRLDDRLFKVNERAATLEGRGAR